MKTDLRTACRYLGMPFPPEKDMLHRLSLLAKELEEHSAPACIYRIYPLQKAAEGRRLSDTDLLLWGQSAQGLLRDCNRAAILVATLGFAADRYLKTAQQRDMAAAAMLDACASAYLETVADEAEAEIKEVAGQFLTDRFSPGYGDLPLSLQPLLIKYTDAEKRLGVHVSSSMMLSPQKSLTAVIGLADTPQPARIRGCACCSLSSSCAYRLKGNGNCEAHL